MWLRKGPGKGRPGQNDQAGSIQTKETENSRNSGNIQISVLIYIQTGDKSVNINITEDSAAGAAAF